MNTKVQDHLANIRMQNAKWTALVDTSSWESTFFLHLVDDKNREIRKLKTANRRLRQTVVRMGEQNEALLRRISTCQI